MEEEDGAEAAGTAGVEEEDGAPYPPPLAGAEVEAAGTAGVEEAAPGVTTLKVGREEVPVLTGREGLVEVLKPVAPGWLMVPLPGTGYMPVGTAGVGEAVLTAASGVTGVPAELVAVGTPTVT